MKLIKNYCLKSFKLGEIANTIKDIANHLYWDITEVKFVISQNSAGLSDYKHITWDEVYSFVELTDTNHFFKAERMILEGGRSYDCITFEKRGDYFELEIYSQKAETINLITDLIQQHLNLEEYILNNEHLEIIIRKLENRINSIEKDISRNKKLSGFISSRFDEKGKQYIAIIEKFLALIDIDAISGLSYEPRKISEKVIEKLETNNDFIVCILTKGTESMWTRDELIYGNSVGAYVFPLVEKGAKFTTGILGDVEYIEFEENNIESAFIKLLEGVKFLKGKKEI